MKIFLQRTAEGFIPNDEASKLWHATCPPAVYSCDVKRARNQRHHALIFALARCVLSNLPEGHALETMQPDEFIKALMLEIGQVDMRRKVDGEVYYIPKSISFESMGEDEFRPISDAVMKVCSRILGVTEHELRVNYIEYL